MVAPNMQKSVQQAFSSELSSLLHQDLTLMISKIYFCYGMQKLRLPDAASLDLLHDDLYTGRSKSGRY